MKRKLIDFEAFKQIKEESLSNAEFELKQAQDVLAKALNVDALDLHCFGESNVTYVTPDESFVYATYHIKNGNITLENIEELIIDEQSTKKKSLQLLGDMVENILNDNDQVASQCFESFLALPTVRKGLLEGKLDFVDDKKDEKKDKKKGQFLFGKKKKEKKDKKTNRDEFKVAPEPRFQVKASKKSLKEWRRLSENVHNYLDFQELGPVASQSEIKRDEKGNVTAVRVPTNHARNESKILMLNFKNMLDTELKVLRGKMKTMQEDASFAHAMSDLRKANAISDAALTQQIIEAISTKWPEVLYLTQTELAKTIGLALEFIGDSNYDDELCNFMAEGILRTATDAFSERVARIAGLSGKRLDKDNVYESFQQLVHEFYPSVDQHSALEMQVFVDLYNAMVEVYNIARKEGNEALTEETVDFLKSLHAVLKEEKQPNLDLAAEAASWLAALVEANVGGAEETWNVSNSTYVTKSGEHPKMSWIANQDDAVASKFNGDWGDSAPVSDGKSYKNGLADEMRNDAWGNWSSEDTWPSLKNPYVPKPFGDYKMKEPNAADSGENDWSRWQSDDTYPNLKNQYAKPSPWDPDKYKMKSDNLVVDK